MSAIAFLVLYQLILQVKCQEMKTVVEGRNINTDIFCNLDREYHPLYWVIQGHIYAIENLPALFIARGHEGLTIPTVDRRMDGWRFQCFTVDSMRDDGTNPGLITILTVLYGENKMNIM